jgi:hypothetical protein
VTILTRRLRFNSALVVAILTMIFSGFAAAPASSAALETTPSPDLSLWVNCSSGGSQMACTVAIYGYAPFSIKWEINGDHRTLFDNRNFIRFSCRAYREVDVKVTVTDSSGATSVAQGACYCNPDDWP